MRWTLRLVAVALALAVVLPALDRLGRADDPMPLPPSTWKLPATQVVPRKAEPPTSRAPSTLFIPELDVAVGFRDAPARNGWLELDDSLTAGVPYANGSTLERGAFLIAAHVNSRKLDLSPFAKLWQVQPGTLIWVNDASGRPHPFITTALASHPKQALPEDVFAPDGPSQLVLVTCCGELTVRPDGSHTYADNIVVQARPRPA